MGNNEIRRKTASTKGKGVRVEGGSEAVDKEWTSVNVRPAGKECTLGGMGGTLQGNPRRKGSADPGIDEHRGAPGIIC